MGGKGGTNWEIKHEGSTPLKSSTVWLLGQWSTQRMTSLEEGNDNLIE